jgi:acyl-CoA synthetase (AMP-forming)/AMP-acid ligase II
MSMPGTTTPDIPAARDNTTAGRTPLMTRLRDQAQRAPHAIAIVEVNGKRTLRTITRSTLVARVEHVARGLTRSGFRAGDRVLFSVRPGIDAVVLVLAVYELGGVLIPHDPGTADALFAARTELLRPRWVMAESVLLVSPTSVVAKVLRWRNVNLAPLGAVQGVQVVRTGTWVPGLPVSRTMGAVERAGRDGGATLSREQIEHAGTTAPQTRQSGDALADDAEAFIVCTSGTTHAPKAVVHTRRSLMAILSATERELAIDSSHVVYSKELHLVLPALSVGARVLMPRQLKFDGARTLRAFQAHRVTHAFLVTRDCRVLLETCLAHGTMVSESLQSLMIGAAPVRAGFLARLRVVLPPHCVAWCVYGATEVLPIARVALEEKVAWTGNGDLVGRPIPGITVRVGNDGQLHVQGERLCAGYAGHEPMLEYATGDLARIDDERIVLLGRAKDMLIRGDHNIYPELYEPLIERIVGVRRAAIIGDFDAEKADERVILVVEPESGVDVVELRERVAREVRVGPNRLDSTALPDEIHVRSLPESGRSNKVDKEALRHVLGARSCA